MLPTINLGPLVIPSASLVYILGIWLALVAVEKAAMRLELPVSWTYNVATIGLAGALIGARLVFVAAHWSAFRQNLLGLIWPLTSGFNLWAGLLVGFWAAFFYARAKRLSAGVTLDALAPGILVASLAVSAADFLAGPGYGTEAILPWSVSLFGILRHPVQLYEILAAILALLAWWAYRKRAEFGGQLFLVATAVFSAGRLLVEAYRANAALTPGGYRIVQIVALAALLAAMLLLMRNATVLETETSG